MKKGAIWFVAVVLLVAFAGLLFIQVRYLEEMVSMRREQFDENVKRALFRVSRQLERQETRHYLDEYYDDTQRAQLEQLAHDDDAVVAAPSSIRAESRISVRTPDGAVFEVRSTRFSDSLSFRKFSLSPGHGNNTIASRQKAIQEMLRGQYIYQKELLDEVVFRILTRSSDRPLLERMNVWQLDSLLRDELQHVGLTLDYELCIIDRDGTGVYRSTGYREAQADAAGSYVQVLFPGDAPSSRLCYMSVYFPGRSRYVLSSGLSFMVPSFIFAGIMLVLFIFVIVTVFRQKKLSDMKTDFVNNMTHELKTPISTISLAAQMLGDGSVGKSPGVLQQISGVINEETKRLRMLVDKVLVMSMFDRQKANLHLREMSVNQLVDTVVKTQTLKIERAGGSIETHLDATDDICRLDEMHFTNIVFNLLDNAYKYAREDVPLHLVVATRDLAGRQLELRVTDNGVGIKKEDQRKIFERFYRVSTGNVHNVKGFGLGLSYVNKVVRDHNGKIRVESVYGEGSTFIITLPLQKAP